MSSVNKLNSVFIGNIPYDATEEELIATFRQAGEVVSFRLITDTEGKPKGYGFCEFKDAATADSAIRNLNNVEFKGRQLRVNSTASDGTGPSKAAQANMARAGGGGMGAPSGRGGPPPLVPGTSPAPPLANVPGPSYSNPVPPGQGQAAVKKAVDDLPDEQVYLVMKELKQLIKHHPENAKKVLQQQPQLCYAILMAQLKLNMIDDAVVESLFEKARKVGPTAPTGGPPPKLAKVSHGMPFSAPGAGPAVAQRQGPALIPGIQPGRPGHVPGMPVPMPGGQVAGNHVPYGQRPHIPAHMPPGVPGQMPHGQVQQRNPARQPGGPMPTRAAYPPQRGTRPMPGQPGPPPPANTGASKQRSEIERLMQLTEDQINQLPPEKAAMLRELQRKVRSNQLPV